MNYFIKKLINKKQFFQQFKIFEQYRFASKTKKYIYKTDKKN